MTNRTTCDQLLQNFMLQELRSNSVFFLRSWTAIGTLHDRAARYSCMVVLLILPFIQRDTRREYINIHSSHKKAKPASRKKLLLTRLLFPADTVVYV